MISEKRQLFEFMLGKGAATVAASYGAAVAAKCSSACAYICSCACAGLGIGFNVCCCGAGVASRVGACNVGVGDADVDGGGFNRLSVKKCLYGGLMGGCNGKSALYLCE